MPISFACEACQAKLKVKDGMAGKRVKCPKCGQPTLIPAEEIPAAPEADLLLPEEPPEPKKAPPPVASRSRAAGSFGTRGRAGSAGPDQTRALIMGLAGGVAAAVLGAFVWYMIAAGAKAKIGWIAWGIGWATGFATYALSGGRGGMLLSVIGAGTAIFGWLLGEYMIYSWMFQDLVVQELMKKSGKLDPEAQEALRRMVGAMGFGSYLKASFEGFDALFILLAAVTGWGVPQKMAANS